jgi:TolB-like protein/tetratricopeptide (TPR) repeat protein
LSLFSELKRRNVLRAATAYAAVAWLVIQIAETTFPAFGLGETTVRIIIILAAAGFIPTLIFAWAFELTPEGFKRDSEVDRASPVSQRMTKRLDRLVMLTLALAVGYFTFDKFVLSPQRQAEVVATATEEARVKGRLEAIVGSYGDKSIAVLPFADLSPDGDQQYFSDGISEELLNLLAKVRELRVISRSSSFALRDRGLSVTEIAKTLNVSYVLEGSVRKAKDRIRVTAQLIEARSDTHIWSASYDRTLDDIFVVQDQISAKVVSELKVRLLDALPVAEATDLTAYDLYLQGLACLVDPSTGPREALGRFERVTEIVPDYAPAHAGVALALILQATRDTELQVSRIEAAAARALQLEPGNSEALTALGRIQWTLRKVDQARLSLEQAIETNPSNPLAYRWLGSTYINRDPVRYLSLVEKAYLIDPLYPGNFQIRAYALGRLGRIHEALEVTREWFEHDPAETISLAFAEWIHLIGGRQDLGLKSVYCAFIQDPAVDNYQGIIWRLMDMGEYDLAEQWMGEIEYRQGDIGPDQKAVIAYELQRPEEIAGILGEGRRRGELTDEEYAFWSLRLLHDFDDARQIYEQSFAKMGRNLVSFDPDIEWSWYLDYAAILKHDGDMDAALALIDQVQPLIEKQVADGVLIGRFLQLQLSLAEAHAIRGETEESVKALRQAFNDGFTTSPYLRVDPHFDDMRQDPGFQAVYSEIEAKLMSQHQDLVDEGMLLTPEQALQLGGCPYDPFTH